MPGDHLTEAETQRRLGKGRCQAVGQRGGKCRHRDGGCKVLVNAVGRCRGFCPDHARAALEGYVLSNGVVVDRPFRPNEWQISLQGFSRAASVLGFGSGKTDRPPED